MMSAQEIQETLITEFTAKLCQILLEPWHAGKFRPKPKEIGILIAHFEGVSHISDTPPCLQIQPAHLKLRKAFVYYEDFYTFLCELKAQLATAPSKLTPAIQRLLEEYSCQRKNVLILMTEKAITLEKDLLQCFEQIEECTSRVQRQNHEVEALHNEIGQLKIAYDEALSISNQWRAQHLEWDALRQQLHSANEFNEKLRQENLTYRTHAMQHATDLHQAHQHMLSLQAQVDTTLHTQANVPTATLVQPTAPIPCALTWEVQVRTIIPDLIARLLQICTAYCESVKAQFFWQYRLGSQKAAILKNFGHSLQTPSHQEMTGEQIQKTFQDIFQQKDIGVLHNSGQHFRAALREISHTLETAKSGLLSQYTTPIQQHLSHLYPATFQPILQPSIQQGV